VELVATGSRLTHDLFFSGHVAGEFIMFLFVQDRRVKGILLTSTILVSVFVLIQHVHYTVDVIAAPFFAYGSKEASAWLDRVFVKLKARFV